MPYDPSLPIEEQVHTSVASSLQNLNTGDDTYIDCVLLHSPLPKIGGTLLAWKTLSKFVAAGKVRNLGIANVTFPILATLVSTMEIKPSVVQNRFYADSRYEVQMRMFCKEQGIVFQSFWTLTGNPSLLKSKIVAELAHKTGVSKEVALYALIVGLEGMTVLNGTTNEGRMVEDLKGLDVVGQWAEKEGKAEWERLLWDFKELIGDD